MKRLVQSLAGVFARVLDGLAVLSGLVVVASLVYLVAARYWFNLPTTGLHTIALIAAMWLYMLGALIASKKNQHLSVTILAHQTQAYPRWQLWHRLIVSIIVCVIVALFCYWTWRMFTWGARFSTTMPSLNIPVWVPQLAIAVNAVGSLGYALRDVWHAIQGLKAEPIKVCTRP